MTEQVYDNQWFAIKNDGGFYYLEEKKAGRGAAILPIVGEKVCLLKMDRPAQKGETTLEIPRGYCKTSEPSVNTAIRELGEETGLPIERLKVTYLGSIRSNTAIIAGIDDLYLGMLPNHTEMHAGETDGEASSIVYVPLEDLWKHMQDGRIQDSYTLAALGIFLSM